MRGPISPEEHGNTMRCARWMAGFDRTVAELQ